MMPEEEFCVIWLLACFYTNKHCICASWSPAPVFASVALWSQGKWPMCNFLLFCLLLLPASRNLFTSCSFRGAGRERRRKEADGLLGSFAPDGEPFCSDIAGPSNADEGVYPSLSMTMRLPLWDQKRPWGATTLWKRLGALRGGGAAGGG